MKWYAGHTASGIARIRVPCSKPRPHRQHHQPRLRRLVPSCEAIPSGPFRSSSEASGNGTISTCGGVASPEVAGSAAKQNSKVWFNPMTSQQAPQFNSPLSDVILMAFWDGRC